MSIEEALSGGNSDPRNETILKMFSLIKIGERAGTGIQTIINTVSKIGYSKPIIEESFNPDRTKMTIFLKNNNFKKEYYETRQNNLPNMSSDENKALDFINRNECITRKKLEEYLSCGKTKSTIILKSLLDKNLIYKEGSSKNIIYLKR